MRGSRVCHHAQRKRIHGPLRNQDRSVPQTWSSAVSKRKPATCRRSSAKSGGPGLWSWMLLLGVAIGGIQVYEHRDSLLPQLKGTVASVSKTVLPPSKPPTREVASERQRPMPTQTVALPASGAPIPPRSIAMPSGAAAMQTASATLPAPRPQVQTVSLTEKTGTFAFADAPVSPIAWLTATPSG